MATSDNSIFLREKLDELARERKDTEAGLMMLDVQIADIQRDAISQEDVMTALGKFTKLFESLPPYQKKEIVQLIIKQAILGPRGIKIALIGKYPNAGPLRDEVPDGQLCCQTSIWLPFVDDFRTSLILKEVREYLFLETHSFCLEAKETM
jgi:hypothetical protein